MNEISVIPKSDYLSGAINKTGHRARPGLTNSYDQKKLKMLAGADRAREEPSPASTQDQAFPSSNDDNILSRLNKNFRLSKAQQILRLLKDQDDLNQRFRHCDLLDDEGDDLEQRQQKDDDDSWSLQEEGDSDSSEHEAERRTARLVALRKHRNSIDPGRCKTSMGFYNQAEVTEIPYDTDSDNVAGLDSACSTPRGLTAAGAVLGHPPASQNLYEQVNVNRVGGAAAATANSYSSFQNSRLRMYHVNGDGDTHVRKLAIPEERSVQSARSSRPKTSATSSSSTRNRYYRQQPHPECQYNKSVKQSQHLHPHSLVQQQQYMQGFGDTRQAIISRLDPHHPMAVRPFCENRVAQDDLAWKGIQPQPQQQQPSQPSTPRGRMSNQGNASQFNHTAVTLYDMSQSFSSDAHSRANTRKTPGGNSGVQASSIPRSTSFAENTRVVPSNRPLLSVDSSPIHLGEASPRGRILPGDSGISRRPRSTRVKKRVGEMPRGVVPTSMHMVSERAHPSMTVMKLPPLESTVSKGGNGRDLVCVGKD